MLKFNSSPSLLGPIFCLRHLVHFFLKGQLSGSPDLIQFVVDDDCPSYSGFSGDSFTNLPMFSRILQLAILGATSTPVASKSDFRVLLESLGSLEFEDIAIFRSFKLPFRINFLFLNTYI